MDGRVKRDENQLRFAVAVFDTAGGLNDAIRHLSREGVGGEQVSCLGLGHILSEACMEPGLLPLGAAQEIPFPVGTRGVSCTPGPVARFLAARLDAGAQTLGSALGHWLIPRHAALIEDAVHRGGLVAWVLLSDGEIERRVCRSLLARNATSVGVHDLVAG